jgi:allophanate hydrolase
VLIGHDADDPLSLPAADRFELGIAAAPARFRFAVPSAATRIFHGDVAAEALFDAAIRRLESFGGTAVAFDYRPLHEAARMLYEDAFIARRYANLKPVFERCGDRFHPASREILSWGAKYSGADVFAAQYRLAAYRKTAMRLFDEVDVMVTPTTPTTFTVAELEADNIRLNAVMGTYTNFVNLMDFCALAVPAGFRPDGLPQGISFVAPPLQDSRLCAFGAAWHRSLGLPLGATGNAFPPV